MRMHETRHRAFEARTVEELEGYVGSLRSVADRLYSPSANRDDRVAAWALSELAAELEQVARAKREEAR